MLHFDISNITHKEREAFDAAINITNQIKSLLQRGEVVTLEKLTGTEQLGEQGINLLNSFIAALQSPAVSNVTALVNTFLLGLGANLQGLIEQGCIVEHGIEEFVHKFQTMYTRLFKHK